MLGGLGGPGFGMGGTFGGQQFPLGANFGGGIGGQQFPLGPNYGGAMGGPPGFVANNGGLGAPLGSLILFNEHL